MSNRLANEISPYLLQHAENPVDWYPWGQEALRRAREEDKPIFLSIGYSACHWCHVMEDESFEDDAIAAKLNEEFVCIKVDREERPDLDQIYMNAVQLLTGHGGWPMSLFLTPDLQPFYGGTYWPPGPRMGMPGFPQVLDAIANAWKQQRGQALEQASQLTEHLQKVTVVKAADQRLRPELLETAQSKLEQSFDFTHGGFGRAPKFPHSMDLQLLLRIWSRKRRDVLLNMVQLNLDTMAHGGIYDHLGGGFSRYSVDREWLVPHFEKMLYDNALLTSAYLDGLLVTGHEEYACVVRETLDYVLRDMTDPEGGFYSAEDADSEGVEGKFYVWTPEQIKAVLGEEPGERFCRVYGVTPGGNFEGRNILHLPKTIQQCASELGWDKEELSKELAESRKRLFAARGERVPPAKDDKVLVSWNALMIDSMARAGGILDEPSYLNAAQRAAQFILDRMQTEEGRLLHSWRQGKARFAAYLDDYAYFINALVTLYEADFQEHWIDEAVRLADILLEQFSDRDEGGFFFTAADHEQLIARNKDLQDMSVPSGNSMAATALLRLGTLCGRQPFLDAAEKTLEMGVGVMERMPTATGQLLIALDMYLGPLPEIVVVGGGDDAVKVIGEFRKRFAPNRTLSYRESAEAGTSRKLDPLYEGKQPESNPPTVFVCKRFACEEPVEGVEAVRALWDRLTEPPAGRA